MILHKHSCNAELSNVDGYLRHINSAFSASFESMKKYKEEANFKRCLGELSLADVKTAIDRAKNIMLRNQRDGYPLTQYKGYAYYIHNPSLDLWQLRLAPGQHLLVNPHLLIRRIEPLVITAQSDPRLGGIDTLSYGFLRSPTARQGGLLFWYVCSIREMNLAACVKPL